MSLAANALLPTVVPSCTLVGGGSDGGLLELLAEGLVLQGREPASSLALTTCVEINLYLDLADAASTFSISKNLSDDHGAES